MERISETIGTLYVPAAARRFLSQNAEDKTWVCPVCGEMPPMAYADGWYGRRRCACERRADEQRQIAAFQQQTRQARMAHTYCWLGSDWSEAGLTRHTFATFERTRQPRAFDLACDFAQRPRGVLAFHGPYGTGKTHLLAAVANQVCAQSPCLFTSVVTLFDAVQARIQHEEDYHDILRRAIQTPLLLLDDIDKLKPSEFREETLYTLINGRTNAGRPLAISSNVTPGELERWVGKAGRSRLMQGLLPVLMQGSDYRLEMEVS